MRVDERREQTHAFRRVQVNDLHASLPQPVYSALECTRLPDYDLADAELNYQTAAVPARCQGRYHDLILVSKLATRLAEGIGLAMYGGVILLDPAIVSPTQQRSMLVEKGCPDWNPPFGESKPGLLQGNIEQRLVF
jgi:hypothetical protein